MAGKVALSEDTLSRIQQSCGDRVVPLTVGALRETQVHAMITAKCTPTGPRPLHVLTLAILFWQPYVDNGELPSARGGVSTAFEALDVGASAVATGSSTVAECTLSISRL